MVVSNMNNEKIKQMDQQSLKFGMDRILSENISPGNSKLEGSLKGCTRPSESPGNYCLSVPCLSGPPCAGCISSLYRCCRMSSSLSNGNFFGSEIHAPQPFRPYTNVLLPGDTNIHQNHGNQQPVTAGGGSKRKRSWSRAVFSNLQRKGLEKRFQLQKYITKPDRRQLAATLGLTDAQVKVWFQNRRMKWRHTKESTAQGQPPKVSEENILVSADSTQTPNSDSECDSDIDVQTVDG